MAFLKDKFKVLFARFILKIMYILPINSKRIFFTSYEGKMISCNPESIYKMLRSVENGNLEYVWEINDLKLIENIEQPCVFVKHNSLLYIYYVMTAKILITNSGISPIFPLRKKQIQINTWHGGGAYKKGGVDVNEKVNGTSQYRIMISGRQTTYFISSSQRFTEIMKDALMIEEKKFLPYGMPRNDIFFRNQETLRDEIRKKIELDKETKVVLYAPTYRGNAGSDEFSKIETLDITMLLEVLSKKFGGQWKVLFRSHYFSSHCLDSNQSCINVNNYPDMQELLCLADVLITDYSSSIWDFSFTEKPGFLFVPDLQEYMRTRDFYSPITEWPYPLCNSNDELYNAVINYKQEEQKEKNRAHHEELHSYENGNATEQIISLIQKISMQ